MNSRPRSVGASNSTAYPNDHLFSLPFVGVSCNGYQSEEDACNSGTLDVVQ